MTKFETLTKLPIQIFFFFYRLDDVRDKLTPPKIIETPALNEKIGDETDSKIVLRPNRLKSTASTTNDEAIFSNVVNKRLQLDLPYFTARPASENDIFTISKDQPILQSVSSTSDVIRFSMTPEVPSISFAQLPKNYLDTPAIEKFKKQEMTLTELQAKEAELHRNESFDFSMPRYYGKSDIILNSSNLSISSVASASSIAKKYVEKSKRLKALRAHIPPLSINGKEKAEKEK